MNISTYEARIAALEAQLGPGPGPVPETGIVSIKITPDLTLVGDVSLNSALRERLPLNSGEQEFTFNSIDHLENGDTYTVKVTPGTTWQANIVDSGEPGTIGETIERVCTVSHDELRIGVLAGEDLNSEDAPYAYLDLTVTYMV